MASSATEWVTTRTVRPSSARPRSSCMTSRSMPGSRPEVGSSRKISDGLVSSSRATDTRLRWPPESEVIFLSLWMSSLSSARTSSTRALRSASAVSAGKRSLAAYRSALRDGQFLVQDVVLRDQADALAQLGELLVEVPVVVEDVALVGGPVAGERLEQGGLAGARRADDGDQGLLGDAEGDVLEDVLAAVDRDREVAGREGDLTGVDELLQPVADQPEGRVADADDVVRADERGAGLAERLAVDVGAVVAAEVADLEAAVGRRPEFGVHGGRPAGRRRPARSPAHGRCA